MDRFLIAFRSLRHSSETGLYQSGQRKAEQIVLLCLLTALLLCSGLGPKYAELSGFLAVFDGKQRELLCIQDLLAEEEGFEPSIQVLARITV